MTKLATLIAVLGIAGGAAYAQSADTDGDGMLSLSEAQAAMPEVTEEAFLASDTDGDGMLSPEEVTAGQEQGLIPA